eukprot:gnl/MRDRNA2_/MRDRNA2_19933_c0_seq1.p1 gnl/MRDRNA2_/MRDRNA2_19933_c0~~gnl/MRDRNA2_/MRDRNA2_19933_c0_seq1.p1  ORF type:complete len:183 (-),score=42.16 gnl/MRDRNA2_/MRDRNA2_19933_c0_seq1:211-759(-)
MVALRTVVRFCPRLPVRFATLHRSSSFVRFNDRRCFCAPATRGSSGPGPENSYISLGQFDGMQGNEAQQTMGIAYLEQALEVQTSEHSKLNPESPKWIGSSFNLAQLHLNLAKQHHQTGDTEPAAEHYQEAIQLLDPILPELPDNAQHHKKAAQFMLSQAYSGLSLLMQTSMEKIKKRKMRR